MIEATISINHREHGHVAFDVRQFHSRAQAEEFVAFCNATSAAWLGGVWTYWLNPAGIPANDE